MRAFPWFALFLIVGESFSLPIRVEIGRGWQELSISSSSPFSLRNISTGELLSPSLQEVNLSFLSDFAYEKGRKGRGLKLKIKGEERVFPSDIRLRLIPLSSNAKESPIFAVSLNGAPVKRFRGELEIFLNNASIPELIDELDLEDYLKGVLPAEIPSNFPAESLKAQAIIARTYAVYSLGRHKGEEFDLCSSQHCQIYLGYDYEKERLNAAIEATKGMIVSYNGRPALTPFHSSCGGMTEDASIWGTSLPYLRAKSDGSPSLALSSEENLKKFLGDRGSFNCEAAPDFRWVRQYTEEDLKSIFTLSLPLLLSDPSLKIGRLKDIRVEERNQSGRVKSLRIETENGVVMLGGDDIRWAFGNGRPTSKGSLPSLLFYIEREEEKDRSIFKIVGGGAGHGIGFCQWGGLGLAKRGCDYRQIINYYFPGTTLRNL